MGQKSKLRSTFRESTGNPEGNAIASPGDLFYARDTGILWIKATGNGTPTGWVAINSFDPNADTIHLFTESGGEVQISTQGLTGPNALRIVTYSEQNVVLPPGGTILAVMDTLTVNGRNTKYDLRASGVDAADFSSVVNSVAIANIFRAGGAFSLTAPANLFSHGMAGPAGTFGQDVLFSVAPNPPTNEIVLFATNTAGANRTGHITATWMVQQGGLDA